MKFFILLAFVATVAYTLPTSEVFFQHWTNFKSTHGKSYDSIDEELHRLNIFRSNLKKIEEHNKKYEAGLTTWEMGINQFADWTSEEFKAYVDKSKANKPKPRKTKRREFIEIPSELPQSVDWRKKGIVSEVKDQGQCGSCWSFSSTGAIEAAVAKNKKVNVLLSEQELIDCTTDENYGNEGCNGGWIYTAFDYIKDNGISSEKAYPYKEKDGVCQNKTKKSVAKIRDYVGLPQTEVALQAAVATVGPVSVAIDASDSLQLYKSGILDDHQCTNKPEDLNHAVLAVGYGTANHTDYWIFKNSWGTVFGEKGYFRLRRNADGQCGITYDNSYPVV